MRRIAFAATLLIAGFAGSASAIFPRSASAQGVSPNGVVYGQTWNQPQDLTSATAMQANRGSGTAADRAARAARQAQFNQNFPGTPIRRIAAR